MPGFTQQATDGSVSVPEGKAEWIAYSFILQVFGIQVRMKFDFISTAEGAISLLSGTRGLPIPF